MSRHRSRRLIPARRGRVGRHAIRVSRAGHHHRRGTCSGIGLAAIRYGRRGGQSHGCRRHDRGRVVAGRTGHGGTGDHRPSDDGSRDDGLDDGHGVGAWRLDGRGLVGAVRHDTCRRAVGGELRDGLRSVCGGGDGLRDRHGVGARCRNRGRLIAAICDDAGRRAVSCELGDALGSVCGGGRSLCDRHGVGARRLNRCGLVGAIGSDLGDVLCSVHRSGIRLVDRDGA